MDRDDELHEDLRPRDNPEGISKFEIDARTWGAREKLVQEAHALTELYGLDPSLAEDIEGARRDDDHDALVDAALRLTQAVKEAKGTD